MAYDAEVRVNTKVNLDEFKKLSNEVDRLEKKFETMRQRADINNRLGIKETSTQMKRLDMETEQTYNALIKAKDALASFKEQHGLKDVSYQKNVEELKQVGETAKKAEVHMSSFSKRVWGLAKRVFVFSIIARAFRAMLNGMKEGLQNFAQFSGEYNKVMSEFKSQTEQLKNSMATAFAPIIMQIIPWLTKLVSWLNTAMNAISMFFAVLSGSNKFAKAKAQAVDYAKALGGVNKEANKLASFDDINVLDLDEAQGGGAVSGADAFEWAEVDTSKMKWAEWLRDHLEDIKKLAIVIGATLLAWKLSSFFTGGLSRVSIAIALLVAGILLVVDALSKWIKEGEITDKQLGQLVVGIMLIGGAIALLTGSWIPLAIAGLVAFVVAIVARGEEIKEFFENAFDNVVGFLQNIKGKLVEWVGILAPLFNTIITVIQTKLIQAKGFVKGFITQVQGLFKGMFQVLKGIFTGDGQMVLDGFKMIFKSFVNGVIDMAEGLVNGIINGFNGMIDRLNMLSFDVPEWLGGGTFGFNINHIGSVQLPRLATGGIVDRPTTALIGEAGREAVIPLENNTEWMDLLAERLGNQQITIKFEGSLSQLAQVLKPALDKENTRVGTTLVVSR